jgi:hypothetical protein
MHKNKTQTAEQRSYSALDGVLQPLLSRWQANRRWGRQWIFRANQRQGPEHENRKLQKINKIEI